MDIQLPRLRLLPATIAAMSLLLVVKSVSLARNAAGEPAAPSPLGQAEESNKAGIPAASPNAAQAAAMPGVATAAPTAGARPAVLAQAAATAPSPAPTGSSLTGPSSPGPSSRGTSPGGGAPAEPLVVPVANEPPISPAERALLLDLRKRRQALDERAALLDQREAVQAAAEAKLSARVDQLTALQARLESLESGRQQRASENWTGLVHVYEAMKPRDAATIFDALDMQVLLQVLDRMQDRKAAPILAAMQPDRARLATQLLAELRMRAVAPPGQIPTGQATTGQSSSPHPPNQRS